MPRGRTKPVCRFEGCDSLNHAKGLCPHHYAKWRAAGKPTSGRKYRPMDKPIDDLTRENQRLLAW